MTDALAVGDGVEDRARITRRIRSALWAIEHGDEAGWRTQVDALIAWRNQPLLQGLVRLARELAQTLGDAPSHGGALPDACAHLEHGWVLVMCVALYRDEANFKSVFRDIQI